jgi:hypothetical protein
MIKANELRLDNFVKLQSGEIVSVNIIYDSQEVEVQLRGDKMISIAKTFGCDKIEPIELTEELLIKGGFKCYEESKSCKWWRNRSFKVKQFKYVHMDDSFTYGSHRKELNYLHQLQNWYFLVIEEELEFKL